MGSHKAMPTTEVVFDTIQKPFLGGFGNIKSSIVLGIFAGPGELRENLRTKFPYLPRFAGEMTGGPPDEKCSALNSNLGSHRNRYK